MSADFQHGEIKGINSIALFWSHETLINPYDETCFAAGTLITMADGKTKAIELIKKGEKILSWNESTQKLESKTVLNAFRKETKEVVEIRLANKLIQTTPDHPFWIINKGWIEAGKLNIDDKLLDEHKQEVSIISLKIIDKEIPVYNLEVEDNHTYFAEGILVHNVSCKTQIKNKTYEIVDGKKVLDENGKELSPVEIYKIIEQNPENKDSLALAIAIDRNELFQILDYFGDWSKDPLGFEKKIILQAINEDIQKSGIPLSQSQSKIFTQSAISADMSYLGTGLAIIGSPVQGNTVGSSKILIEKGKVNDYLFGRASGNQHNIDRASQNAMEMKRLGIQDNTQGYSIIESHLKLVAQSTTNISRSFSTQYGTFEVRESFIIGPSGQASKFESTWQVMPGGTRRLTTVIPYGGRR